MEVTIVLTLFLMLAGVFNRTELSPDGASIFSGIPVDMFVLGVQTRNFLRGRQYGRIYDPSA